MGERVTTEYLKRLGFEVNERNVSKVFGELDIIATRQEILHFIEVKALRCIEFPKLSDEVYDPSENLHRNKLRKVIRMSKWYIAKTEWEGEWQIDGACVWLRVRDGMARIRYYPQIA